ncbi:SufE family protein [Rhodocytophaga aerolata]|uniref:SufE family protein n=1 Tax=Rhodocytophaga aerolata TaxID=455078 RepID=A0ABT8QZK6_9BACT|nr:SufE family protein [Rhodocytophaga aerolata]MDO1445275.1 SufE family protein [Rhodocytophaga aerolata]
MTINQIQDEIIEEFALFDDWTDKYEYIIDIGKKLPPLSSEYKTEENKIKGCQSQVWLHAHMDGDKLLFEGDSDAVIVKGLIGLLIRVLSGQKPEDIAKATLYFIDKIGMSQHLAQTRSNGLASMVKQMKLYGIAFQAKQEVK